MDHSTSIESEGEEKKDIEMLAIVLAEGGWRRCKTINTYDICNGWKGVQTLADF